MEPLDAAAEQFRSLIADVKTSGGVIRSEADTRLKIIDRIVTRVLGWPLAEITTEEQAGSGYVDYRLCCNGFARLILEAKRNGAAFGLGSRQEGKAYKLSGASFRTEPLRTGLEQGIRYC